MEEIKNCKYCDYCKISDEEWIDEFEGFCVMLQEYVSGVCCGKFKKRKDGRK